MQDRMSPFQTENAAVGWQTVGRRGYVKMAVVAVKRLGCSTPVYLYCYLSHQSPSLCRHQRPSHSWTWGGKLDFGVSKLVPLTVTTEKIGKRHPGSPAQADYPGDPNADEALNLIGYPLRKLSS